MEPSLTVFAGRPPRRCQDASSQQPWDGTGSVATPVHSWLTPRRRRRRCISTRTRRVRLKRVSDVEKAAWAGRVRRDAAHRLRTASRRFVTVTRRRDGASGVAAVIDVIPLTD